jgi:Reverse transcriptase (RNA-dependent DNA polymerase)
VTIKCILFTKAKSIQEKHLFYKFQSGFRSGFSTDSCLLYLTDFIRLEIDKGNVVGMVLLDLQKAFDTVNHSILLRKLKACGLGDSICNWFKSYLSDRQQLVDISGTFSSHSLITCGVPQGSILGPLLFLIYVNDMPAVVKNKLLLYADDSAILVSGKNVSDVEKALSDDLLGVSQWLIDNKLSLHLGKTESILFGSRQKLRSQPNLNIICNGTTISHTSSVKYLGVSLDQFLSFKLMAESILKKANARLKFLYRKKDFLNKHIRKQLVMSLIQCHYDYACSVWYHSLTQTLKNKLQTTQNKMVRFILSLDSRSHVGHEHFRSLNWLPVQSRVEQIMLCHVFKINKNLAPEYLKQLFTSVASSHRYKTRLSTKGGYCVPKVKSFGSKSFCYMGSKLWNKLLPEVTETNKYYVF